MLMCLLETYRHAGGTTKVDRALLECLTDRQADQAEITRLLAPGFIKEVYNLEWLANLVLVQKKNKEWRMCVDYTDLNKHCCWYFLTHTEIIRKRTEVPL